MEWNEDASKCGYGYTKSCANRRGKREDSAGVVNTVRVKSITPCSRSEKQGFGVINGNPYYIDMD